MRFNIAARAGRWSAGHWKTAVSAWLAFCIVAIALGAVAGTKMLKQADTAAGGAKHGRRDPRACGIPGSRGRERARPVEARDARRSGIPRGGGRRRAGGARAAASAASPLAARVRRTAARSRRTAARRSSSSRSAASRTRRTRRCSPCSTQSSACRQRHPGSPWPSSASRARTHELNNTLSKDFQRAEYSSVPVTLVDPARGLRRARRGRAAGAARVLRRPRHDRALRAREPRRRSRRRDEVGDPADRDGGRHRLLALLPPPRAGGARARSLAAGGAAERRPHVRARGLHLRPDGADRDGGDAVHRQRRLHVDRGRRDADGRGRADRLALDPAGAALQARAPRRQGPHPASLAARPGGESRVWGYVLDRVLRRPALSAALSGGALLALAVPTLGLHTQLPSFTDLPKSLAIVRTYDAIQRAFPGAQTPAKVVDLGRHVDAPRVQRAIADARAAGARQRADVRAGLDGDQPCAHRRDGVDLAARRRQRRAAPWPRCKRCATASSRRPSGA